VYKLIASASERPLPKSRIEKTLLTYDGKFTSNGTSLLPAKICSSAAFVLNSRITASIFLEYKPLLKILNANSLFTIVNECPPVACSVTLLTVSICITISLVKSSRYLMTVLLFLVWGSFLNIIEIFICISCRSRSYIGLNRDFYTRIERLNIIASTSVYITLY